MRVPERVPEKDDLSWNQSLYGVRVTMPGFGNVVQKAFYLGVGIASYAGEQANNRLKELRVQGQKLADEMVKRGEMTAEEASKFVDDMVKQAQQDVMNAPASDKVKEPRKIEIVDAEEETTASDSENPDKINDLRQQVESLQEELRRLQRE